MRPDEKHAVITGGTGSLGSAIATHLMEHGWQVAAPGSRELDVRDASMVKRFFDGRPVDLLVCAAGITMDAAFARLSETAWDETMTVNLHGASLCSTEVFPAMMERGYGHIVFISSQSALHPPIGQAAYATAKAALLGLTTDLARRDGASNVRVNAILPGFLESRMTSVVSETRRQEVVNEHALGRFNTCEAVAAFIRFLHESLPHTSGQIFQLDSRPNFFC